MQQSSDNDNALKEANASGGRAGLVDFFVAQLEAALDEAGQEIEALSQCVVTTAQQASSLSKTANAAKVDTSTEFDIDTIRNQSSAITASVNGLFLRTQFGDRLKQRLSNVQTNLGYLAEHMRNNESPMAEQQWLELLGQVRATFTMESEREMFDSVFASAQELNPASASNTNENSQPDGLMLFDKEFGDD